MSDGLALSALDWWIEAGVDTLVDDSPRDWLTAPAAAASAPAAKAAPSPAETAPQDLAGFRAWLLSDASIPGPPAARIDACGDPASGTVVVVDMPEAGDRAEGRLLGAEVGALFDRMLGAMKLERAQLYMLPFAPARSATGKIGAAEAAVLIPLLRRHLAFVAPKRLLLLGDAPARALTGLSLASARGETRMVSLGDAVVPAIASFHPRFVLDRPDYRKPAWADLQLFMAL